MTTNLKGIPEEIIEAAIIDGCNEGCQGLTDKAF